RKSRPHRARPVRPQWVKGGKVRVEYLMSVLTRAADQIQDVSTRPLRANRRHMRCSRSECACHASVSFGGHIASTQWTIWTEGAIGRSTMNVFAIAVGMMAVTLLVAGWQRPRLAVIVAAI